MGWLVGGGGRPSGKSWRAGGYSSGPIEYSVYIGEDDQNRTRLTCPKPSFRYPEARGAWVKPQTYSRRATSTVTVRSSRYPTVTVEIPAGTT